MIPAGYLKLTSAIDRLYPVMLVMIYVTAAKTDYQHACSSLIMNIVSFHPEMALLCDLGVNLRDFLCSIHCVCFRAIP